MAAKTICLSISGGGILGIGPTKFLTLLEKDLTKNLYDTFSGFAGTSTGSIIAGCLDEGMTAAEILTLYEDHGKDIFKKYTLIEKLKEDGTQPTYDNTFLKEILQKKLKGTCSQWKKEIFIPSFDMMSIKNPEKVFDRGDSDIPKWFAVLASTSAPTYFMPAGSTKNWIDGGMFANNPIAVLQAGFHKRAKKNKFKILHLNTGMTLNKRGKGGNKNVLGWGLYILDNFVARSSYSETYKAKANLGDNNVFVVSPTITTKYEMDDLSKITTIEKIWEAEYQAIKTELFAWLNS